MKKYIVRGGNKLTGDVKIFGAKNVVLKAIVAACMTSDEVILRNVPQISDVYYMTEMVKNFGGRVKRVGHTLRIKVEKITNTKLPLETAVKMRASSLFFAPFLSRCGEAQIPNPGGDRIGARRIDMHIEGLEKLGAEIIYNDTDGYFYSKVDLFKGNRYRFSKNTHTGTEQMILAAVVSEGTTILENAAEEPEVDDLIALLNLMGGRVKRKRKRVIEIEGVKSLRGATYTVKPDRNEAVTFAIASALTGGGIWLENVDADVLTAFLEVFKKAGGSWETSGKDKMRFYIKEKISPVSVVTEMYPGFMTDWQGPWCVLMTQANGESVIHETIYEDRFQYVKELNKMGAAISLFNPHIDDPKEYYNFNYDDCNEDTRHAVKVSGPVKLRGTKLSIGDLRAGATLVLAALIAMGESVIYGIEQIERGYEDFDKRLRKLGADVEYVRE